MNKKRINIHQAKTHLSRFAKQVKAGETLILCDRNIPFAEIRPLGAAHPGKKRPFGIYKGQFTVPQGFNKADSEISRAFNKSILFPTK